MIVLRNGVALLLLATLTIIYNISYSVESSYDYGQKTERETTKALPEASVTITSFPAHYTIGIPFNVAVSYTSNFHLSGHRGRIYLEIIDAGMGTTLKEEYRDNNGAGYNGASGSMTFTTSIPSAAESIYFRVFMTPMELNPWVISEYSSYPRDGTYPYQWSGNGVTHDIYYKGSLIISDNVAGNACYCSGITYEVFMDAYAAYNTTYGYDSIGTLSVDGMKNFRISWYIADAGIGDKGPIRAIVTTGIGFEVTDWNHAQDGDFIQLWRHSGSGHSVIFHEWVENPEDEIIGLNYWSTQPSTDGINFNTEYFGESSGVDPAQTYIGRVVKPPDADDWSRRYDDDDTAATPTLLNTNRAHGWLFF